MEKKTEQKVEKEAMKQAQRVGLWLLDLVINLGVIVVLVIVIQKWIIAPFDVSGASMCNTLNVIKNECVHEFGEKILINEASYVFGDPERGDIVVFKAPDETEDVYFVKRIIGLPGETVDIVKGEIFITPVGSEESFEIVEDYLSSGNKNNTQPIFSDFSKFEVPEGKYFLMGDNRAESRDSRSCFQNGINISCKSNSENAFIKSEAIRGKAWIVWWPVTNIRTIKHAEYPELDAYYEDLRKF